MQIYGPRPAPDYVLTIGWLDKHARPGRSKGRFRSSAASLGAGAETLRTGLARDASNTVYGRALEDQRHNIWPAVILRLHCACADVACVSLAPSRPCSPSGLRLAVLALVLQLVSRAHLNCVIRLFAFPVAGRETEHADIHPSRRPWLWCSGSPLQRPEMQTCGSLTMN